MSDALWTLEKIGLLAKGWSEGLASREIAMTVGLSAAAVRAKRKRMGLPERSEAAAKAMGVVCGVALVGRPVAPAADQPGAPPPLAGSTPRPWTQRMMGECAWPVLGLGDETLSCCLPVEGRGGYCMGHRALLRGEPWPPVDPGNVTLFRARAAS